MGESLKNMTVLDGECDVNEMFSFCVCLQVMTVLLQQEKPLILTQSQVYSVKILCIEHI